ncbi:hypothetical protein CRG98_045419 [Punica granatum]|uniref:Uncharacterized protein n=1 Tax=Punica granatum TaxID=22663 RepID=A0A2I0HR49_PUNGR|nr:hypothetical protein CRG98_045419 [Punica granatum]
MIREEAILGEEHVHVDELETERLDSYLDRLIKLISTRGGDSVAGAKVSVRTIETANEEGESQSDKLGEGGRCRCTTTATGQGAISQLGGEHKTVGFESVRKLRDRTRGGSTSLGGEEASAVIVTSV